MAHTHADVTVTSAAASHSHLLRLGDAQTQPGYYHVHGGVSAVFDGHSHSFTLAFGAAELGAVNWWEHKHPISLVSVGSGGAAHTHGVSGIYADQCEYEWGTGALPHTHGAGTLAVGSGGAAHTDHGVPTGTLTDYADPSGTPENHVHPFSFTSTAGGSHSHPFSGNSGYTTCPFGYRHRHAAVTPTVATSHGHGVSGNSGSGGEPWVPAVAPTLMGEGLFWIVG